MNIVFPEKIKERTKRIFGIQSLGQKWQRIFSFTFIFLVLLLVAFSNIPSYFHLLPKIEYVQAGSCASAGSGNWNTAATWTVGCGTGGTPQVPVAADDVTITAGHTITMDAADTTINSLTFGAVTTSSTVNFSGTNILRVTGLVSMPRPSAGQVATLNVAGGQLFAGSFTMSATTISSGARTDVLTISTGTVTISGTYTCGGTTGCVITFSNSGLLKFGGTMTGGPFTFTKSSSTVEYTGSSQAIQVVSYNNLTLSGSNSPTGAVTSVTGNMLLSGTVNYTTSANLAITGTLIINANNTLTIGASRTLTVTDATTVNGNITFPNTAALKTFTGGLTIASGGTYANAGNSTLSFGAGGLTNSSGGTISMGAGLATFSTTGAIAGGNNITFGGGVTITTGAVTNNNTGTVTITTTLTLTGNWTQGTGSILSLAQANPFSGSGTFNASSNANTVNYTGSGATIKVVNYSSLTLSGGGTATGAVTSVTGTLTMSGSTVWAQDAITSTIAAVTLSGTANLTTGANMAISGALTVGSGTTFTTGADFTLSVTGTTDASGALALASTGTKAFTGLVTISSTGSITNASTGGLTFSGGLTINSSGSFSAAGGPTISFGGDFTNNSGSTINTGTGLVTFTAFKNVAGSSSITFGGGVTVNSSVTVTNTNAATVTITTTLTLTGNWTQGSSSTLSLAQQDPFSGSGTFDASSNANTVNYTSASQAVKAVTYVNLTLSGSGTPVLTNVSTINGNLSLSGAVSPSTGANTSVGGDTSVGTGTSLTVAAGNTLNVTGSVSVTSTGTITNNSTGGFTISTNLTGTGGLTQGTDSVLNVAGTVSISSLDATASGNTVNYNGAAQTVKATPYVNLTLSGSGAKTITSLATINGNFTVSGTANATTAAVITIGGNLDVSTTGAGGLTLAGYDFSVAGTTSVTGILTNSSATGTKTFTGDVTISGASSNWNETAAAVINFGGSLANSANSWTGSTGTHTFTGSGKTINGSTTTTIPNVSVSGTVTNNGTMTVSTTLGGVGGFTNGSTGTLNFGGSSIGVTNFTASASGNTVRYNSTTTDQTIRGTTYHHLTIDKTGRIATLGAAITINGDLNITNGTLDTGDGLNYAINVKGDWTNNGSFTARNGIVSFSGADSSTQKIQGSANTSFYDFTASMSGNSSGRTLQFKGGSTTIVSDTWTITGYSGKVIILESSDTNSWIINPTAASVTYVNVSRSTNTGVSFCATYSTSGGNNSGWSISGTSNCGKYLTSCWSGPSNSCSNDPYSDDVIGALWHRSSPSTMNTPYDDLNEPPTKGSWYVGMLKGLEVTISGISITFQELNAVNNFTNTASTQTTIKVTTTATNGYIVTAWETQEMTHNDFPLVQIDNFYGTYDDPLPWTGNCITNSECGFGFTSSDDEVGGEEYRYGDNPKLFAGFPEGPSNPIRVMDYLTNVTNNSYSITYRISASNTQRPGTYTTTIVYIITAQY